MPGRGQLKDGREGSVQTVVREGAGCPVYLARSQPGQSPGSPVYPRRLCNAGQSSAVPVPAAHLRGVLPGGQAGVGLGWGSEVGKAAPLGSGRLALPRACRVPAIAQMCPGAQPLLTRAGPPQAHGWEATDKEVFFHFSDSTAWGLSHTPDCCFRLRAVGKHVKNRQCKNRQLFTFCSQRNLKPQH